MSVAPCGVRPVVARASELCDPCVSGCDLTVSSEASRFRTVSELFANLIYFRSFPSTEQSFIDAVKQFKSFLGSQIFQVSSCDAI